MLLTVPKPCLIKAPSVKRTFCVGISRYPATVTMPKIEQPFPSILGFLCQRFPKVPRECWESRIAEGKVLGEDRLPITGDSPYVPQNRIFYFREVEEEPLIPFQEKILFQNDQFLVCCKPHFLPVTPGGRYVNECLLNRLRRSTGNDDLVPLHRIDRETAGLVLFSTNRNTRALYSDLFTSGAIEKTYHALSAGSGDPGSRVWLVEDRIVPGEPWFRMTTAPGAVNARSRIELVERKDGLARFLLSPVTGKTHQLRVHMSGLGFGILNDRYYPALQDERDDDFATPLQLVAKCVKFKDPLTGKTMEFVSERELLW
jgi:tRNA pseudouridine32 synthase / 23S rRNA pseudouridine746 synthase